MNAVQELTPPLAPARSSQSLSASADSDQARAIAEVQAQMMIAKRYPRDEQRALDKILTSCTRKGLAEVAMYSYARGGTAVTGPSIRLAEVLVSAWGNILPGWRELSRQNGVSEVEAYAWDLESNTRWALTFQVKHWRDTKSGGKAVTDERDIYELMANMASRRVRACILKLIPGDIVDAAVVQCEETLNSKADVKPEHITRTVEAFVGFGVSKEMIEAKIQRRIESITAPQVVQLGKIFNSLKDGMSKPEDWFDTSLAKKEAAKPEATEGKSKPLSPEAKEKSQEYADRFLGDDEEATGPAEDDLEPKRAQPKKADATAKKPEIVASTQTVDTETGEVNEQAKPQIKASANPNFDFGE